MSVPTPRFFKKQEFIRYIIDTFLFSEITRMGNKKKKYLKNFHNV